jgi:hypothetical protein
MLFRSTDPLFFKRGLPTGRQGRVSFYKSNEITFCNINDFKACDINIRLFGVGSMLNVEC